MSLGDQGSFFHHTDDQNKYRPRRKTEAVLFVGWKLIRKYVVLFL